MSPSPSSTTSGPARWIGVVAVLALVAALAALGLVGWIAFRPSVGAASPPTARTGVDAGVDAKKTICAASDLVRTGVSINTNAQPPGGPADVTGSMAVAANARVALSEGGHYLLLRLDPATPQPLFDDVRQFANALLDIGAAATAGALNSDPDQAARLSNADAVFGRIVTACQSS